MAGHVAFIPQTPLLQVASPALSIYPRHYNRQLAIGHQAAANSEDNVVSACDDWTPNIIRQITEHPKFVTLFPCIKSCLQLNDQAWAAYAQLRENTEAKSKLESSHSSIWHVPPEDIWTVIVSLRQGPSFSDFQSNILTEVEDAYCKTHRSIHVPVLSSTSRDGLNWNPTVSSVAEPLPHFVQEMPSVVVPLEDHAQKRQLSSSQPTITTLSPTVPTLSTARTGSQRHRARQAPDGMLYHCPSRRCPRTFKRLAHYAKHLDNQHPDFTPQHPRYTPEMSLRPRASSSTSNERPANIVRFENQPTSTYELNGPGLMTYGSSRRGSFISLSSHNSAGLSSSVIDDRVEDSFAGAPDIHGFDSLMLHDSNVSYMGGGTVIHGISQDPDNTYYTWAESH